MVSKKKVVDEVPVDPDACNLYYGPPVDFGYCTKHEHPIPLGGLCVAQRARYETGLAVATKAGDLEAAILARKVLELDDKAIADALAHEAAQAHQQAVAA